MADGWCPFARQHRGFASGPSGYPAGARNQNKPLVFVDHRMGGYKRTLDDDQWRHANDVSVHAGIGRDGSLDQYVSIYDAAWGNGVAGSIAKYDRANPLLAAIEGMGGWVAVSYAGGTSYALVSGGVNMLNTHSISTEHEDEMRDQPWTQAMVDTSIRWKRWCLEELRSGGWQMDVSPDVLVGHFQIDAVNRSGCPGTNWPKAEILAGLKQGDDDMQPFLAWCPDYAGGSMWLVGPFGAAWLTQAADVAVFEAKYGKATVALRAATLNAIAAAAR